MKKIIALFVTLTISYNLFAQLNSVSSVIQFLNGKTFTHPEYRKSGEDYSAQTLTFIGLEANSNSPFTYNPYPNATDFAGKVWDFPQNRYLFKITSNGQSNEYCIYLMAFHQNGSVQLEFREIIRHKRKETKLEYNPTTKFNELVEEVKDVIDYGNSGTFYLFLIKGNASYTQPIPTAGLGWYVNQFWDRENTFLCYQN